MPTRSAVALLRSDGLPDLSERIRRRARARWSGIRDRHRSHTRSPYSYQENERPPIEFRRHLLRIEPTWFDPDPATLRAAGLWLDGWFDVFGSGWMPANRGTRCRGYGGHQYDPGPAVGAEDMPDWIRHTLPEPSRFTSLLIWSEVSPAHQPIDWNLDLRSGFQWDPAEWHADISVSPAPGADIKVPWELARLQHLPTLAVLATQDRDREGDEIARRALDQLLDFIATNPPGFGTPWACAMDVAIRLVNIVTTFEIIRRNQRWANPRIRRIIHAVVMDHAAFIDRNLEWHRTFGGNHYFADLCGLLAAGLVLPPSPTSDRWLAFAVSEILSEVQVQFDVDGVGTEGSTAYHRLVTEMASFAFAVIGSFDGHDWHRVACAPAGRVGPCRLDGNRPTRIPEAQLQRLAGAAEFLEACTNPDGEITQVGDDDSGHLLKLSRPWRSELAAAVVGSYENMVGYDALPPEAEYLVERSADHRGAIDMARGILQPNNVSTWNGQFVAALQLGATVPVASTPITVTVGATEPDLGAPDSSFTVGADDRDGPSLRTGLLVRAFPSFGLVVFNSPALFATFRCGPVGQRGRGGHAHCDQLAIEIWIDGRPVVRDPGMPTYCGDPALRNWYRSPAAHWVPNQHGTWPDADPFELPLIDGGGTLLAVRGTFAVGQMNDRSGVWQRRIEVLDQCVRVQDWAPLGSVVTQGPPDVLLSPGYGWIATAERP